MGKRIVYLDNAATTQPLPEVVDEMLFWLEEGYGNPSAKNRLGFQAKKGIDTARETIARCMGVEPHNIIFTSGGSESNNMAIKRLENDYDLYLSTPIEHPSVAQAIREFKPLYLFPTAQGECLVTSDIFYRKCAFASVMWANNITGMVMNIKQIRETLPDDLVFHVDATQIFGKKHLSLQENKIDMLTASSHKIHGPKGVGLLYVSDRVIEEKKISPLIDGGEQENGYRSGTENVPGIMGFAKAVEIAYRDMEFTQSRLHEIHDYFVESLVASDLDFDFNGDLDNQLPSHLNVSFNGIKGEQLQSILSEQGVCVSTGSACSSYSNEPNRTLQYMGLNEDRINSSIRFSFSRFTTKSEIDYTMQVLNAVCPMMK